MEKEQKIDVGAYKKSRKILRFIRIPSSKKPYITPALVTLGDVSKLTYDASIIV